MKKDILRIKNGTVELMNISGQRIKTYYNKSDAQRVDWYDEEKKHPELSIRKKRKLKMNFNN